MLEAGDSEALRHVPVRDGDLVALDGDAHELYAVVLVRENRCWLRNLQTGMDALSSVAACRRVGREADPAG